MAASAFHCADNQGTGGMVRQSSIARYDSASSEAFQQYSTVDPITGLPPQPGAPMHAALRRHDSGFEGAASCAWHSMPAAWLICAEMSCQVACSFHVCVIGKVCPC